MEIRYQITYEVSVPPEFFYAMLTDIDVLRRANPFAFPIEVYIDKEEVGGHYVATFRKQDGEIDTHTHKITALDPPFLFQTEISLDEGITIHTHQIERTETGTRYTLHTRYIYHKINWLHLLFFPIVKKRGYELLKLDRDRFVEEVENEYVWRKTEDPYSLGL